MKNSSFGVIIKINNIDICRNFYQNVLNLGDPVSDSSFCVEFNLTDDFFLILEKTDARFLEHESAAVSWSCKVESTADVRHRARLDGYKLNMNKRTHEGEVLYRCQDPEKNIFYIFSDEVEKDQDSEDSTGSTDTIKLKHPKNLS